MMAVGEYSIVKDSFTKKDGSSIDVNYYVEPEYEKMMLERFLVKRQQ
jgi:hypothetical protein